MKNECPNCGSTWGIGSEEWEWQECDYCGWPDNVEENLSEDDEGNDYDEEDWDWEQEEKNPNDSRNL